jgi:hypothetical protein
MGKIFRIEFQFVNVKHSALVSVSTSKTKPYYHIQLIDNYLKKIFSTEHIRYEGEQGYQALDQYRNPFTREMLHKMATAIDRTLTGQFAIIRWLMPF